MCTHPSTDPLRYEGAALEAIAWLRCVALETPHGLVWPKCPAKDQRVEYGLYHGVSGVILTLLDAYRTTGDAGVLKDACRGADALAHRVESETEASLYSGLAGECIALLKVFEVTECDFYLDHARTATKRLLNLARQSGDGLDWNDYTDVMAGTAGIGLALLKASVRCGLPEAIDVARCGGLRLLDLAIERGDGMQWLMETGSSAYMPNFSHGTSGVAYFLSQLFTATGEMPFLRAAERGARHLLDLAQPFGGGIRIYAEEPNRKDVFYLGWCHGPAGTARLFYRLWEITGRREWGQVIERLTRPILASGIPEQQPPGYWNKVGCCCGSAGIAEYLLDLYELGGPPEYLDLATRLTHHLLDRGTSPWWVQSPLGPGEPEVLPLTGFMQGTSGLATWLLRFSRFLRCEPERPIRFPDCPWPAEQSVLNQRRSTSALFEHPCVE
jgi:lantibiotic modifying enzyme